jgi:hypothetical protein
MRILGIVVLGRRARWVRVKLGRHYAGLRLAGHVSGIHLRSTRTGSPGRVDASGLPVWRPR